MKKRPRLPRQMLPSDADGQVVFTGPCAADQHDIALLRQKLSGRQITGQRLVDRHAFEAELIDLFRQGQLGNRHLVFDRARLLLTDLGVQQIAPSRQHAAHAPAGQRMICCGSC